MNRKRFILTLTVLLMLSLFSSCGCQHEWTTATCTTPKTCSLCNEIEGEAAGHNWLDATCTAAKTCKNCSASEGTPLGHEWQEATTEAPITCSRCKVTEGSKLMTDPRFTTASTKEFYGKWTSDVVFTGEMLELDGYIDELPATLVIEFGKTGEFIVDVELDDYNTFMDVIKTYTTDVTYATFTAQGLTKDQADEAMRATYNMTVEEYVTQTVDNIDLDDIFGAFSQDLVYYVGQNGIYSSDSWYGEFEPSEYTFEGDTLIIDELALEEGGEPLVWTKVTS